MVTSNPISTDTHHHTLIADAVTRAVGHVPGAADEPLALQACADAFGAIFLDHQALIDNYMMARTSRTSMKGWTEPRSCTLAGVGPDTENAIDQTTELRS